MRRPFVAGNWKMHLTPTEARAWCRTLRDRLAADDVSRRVELGAAPAFPALEAVGAFCKEGLPLTLIGQNVHQDKAGAYTGAVSAAMLLDCGCTATLIGHSERRHLFAETDALIARKVRAAQGAGLVPVLCIGETDAQREAGRTEAVLEEQVRRDLGEVEADTLDRLVVAYEPVWAIGTGKVATVEQVDAAHRFLRGVLGGILGAERAAGIRLLYGGSVKPDNAAGLAALPDVDGFLVGGASLDPAGFHAIAQATAAAKA